MNEKSRPESEQPKFDLDQNDEILTPNESDQTSPTKSAEQTDVEASSNESENADEKSEKNDTPDAVKALNNKGQEPAHPSGELVDLSMNSEAPEPESMESSATIENSSSNPSKGLSDKGQGTEESSETGGAKPGAGDSNTKETRSSSQQGPRLTVRRSQDPGQSDLLKRKKTLWEYWNPLSKRTRLEIIAKWGQITKEMGQIRSGTIPMLLFLTKIFLLHIRYVFGYLSAGFLVSSPIYLGTKMIGQFGSVEWEPATFWHIYYSIITGLICLVPFVLLIPVTRIEWENMRVPEFKIFELTLTRWASYVSLAYLITCAVMSFKFGYDVREPWWFDLQIAWMVFTLMVSAWAKIKIQTIMFRDFYELEEREGLILRHSSSGPQQKIVSDE